MTLNMTATGKNILLRKLTPCNLKTVLQNLKEGHKANYTVLQYDKWLLLLNWPSLLCTL